MGPEHVEPAVVGATSRRALREAELSGTSGSRARPARRAAGRAKPADARIMTRWMPRIGLLGALTAITIVLPLSGNVSPGNGTFVAGAEAVEAGLVSTVDAVTGVRVATLPPPSVTVSAAAVATRSDVSASRSQERGALPGCDGTVEAPGSNGELKTSDLCTLWSGDLQLRGDAASALAELNLAFRARFGHDLCLVSAYRTLAEQRTLKATKGGLAAIPGRSNHGWGLAIDLCSSETRGASWTWLKANGAMYGWENPAWALSGGSGPHEPWHWEYTRGVKASGEYFDS
ncbi:M15 family metallopeptidase [Pengzhenrongella sicca]|uniref:M15 family metallopeptidase n=1 Tax=Pengzhenrongella sicca TaxID=2819238 RepID=A0A8A4ZGA5_9MICO|nr:M15 family metallopeptidase [Pengzhenrongella sicca]QTE30315.1 M15 family metallopeptidase [Pengzhenrongella sicca]